MRDGMPGWEIFRLDLSAATRTIELDDPNPVWIRCEVIIPRDQRRVNLPRVAIVKQAAFFVIIVCWADDMSATITQPSFGIEIEVQVFSDSNPSFRGHSPFPG